MKNIELLAPAKDLECGIAAIDCGADALYIGASKFGARESAGNSLDDISELVKYAHKYWAKVYATVNTLLHDDEIPAALGLIRELYDLGIDGLIIQDVGLLEHDLPPIPIIASTQMHNNTPEKVGIRRAILARELSLDQIHAIREKTHIELEAFIHGSLCVCYSGQCYLSYAIGGRSGNRGQCAQPCRKAYDLVDESGWVIQRGKHLLSLKDLNLSQYIGDLIHAGVTSFKIEGRLKDKTYVSNIVAYYRKMIDQVRAEKGLSKASSGTSIIDFEPNPEKTFNRGYTTYFVDGKREKIGSIDTPKMVGELLGTVVAVSGKTFTIDSNIPIHSGDGICWFNKSGELRGTLVNAVKGRSILPDKINGIEDGMSIYRNHDHEFLTRLEKSHPERKIDVWLDLSETLDGLLIAASDEDGNEAEYSVQCAKELAQKPEQALENIRKQLAKSGGTDYVCSEVEVKLSQAYFLPISVLNSLRREVLERLTAVREENRPRASGSIFKNDVQYPAKELTYEGNVLNKSAQAFYRRHGVGKIAPAPESRLVDLHGHRLMTTRYCLRHQLGACLKERDGKDRPSQLYLVDEEGHRFKLRFDCAKCQMEVWG